MSSTLPKASNKNASNLYAFGESGTTKFPSLSIYLAFLYATWYGNGFAPILSIAFTLNKLHKICDSPYNNSPFSSTASAISSVISEYSITFGFPLRLQNTPTFS